MRVGAVAARRVALVAVIVVGGFFRFDGLKWGEHGWPHPDERAVISQTYDMLVGDHYRPTIHTWGHFAYYSTLFAYKAYLHLQHQFSALPDVSAVSGQALTAAGVGLSLLVYLLAVGVSSLPRRARMVALLAPAIVAAGLWWGLGSAMSARVAPQFADVAFVGRFIAALVSTLSLLLLYALGATLYSPVGGLLAAAFLAVTVRATQLAHFFAVEPLQTFCVLLALLCAARLWKLDARRSRPEFHAAMVALFVALGVAIGMAMSSKFSSAPLFVLPPVTYLLVLHRRAAAPLFLHSSLVLCLVAAFGTWFALQPYIWEPPFVPFESARAAPLLSERWLQILFSRDFAAQIAEQSRMTAGKGGGPWVQQFADTTPYLTMLREMVRWSFGWPLGVVCVGGFLYALARNLFKPTAADVLLLSYAGVTFLITGGFKASFPRYTLPILPVVCLFGAQLCLSLERRASRWVPRLGGSVAAVALAAGLWYCAAYAHVYNTPHAWTTASLWIFKNVPSYRPDGLPTRIVHEEWDDELPVRVPPHDRYYMPVLMAPYHGDGDEKATRVAEQLAFADWICLPTSRLYNTIFKVHDRYPVTSAYYQLLFAGDLGFTLRTTIYQPPQLWPFRLFDLTADESHYVYDHPKAVIFEKTRTLSVAEIKQRLLAAAAQPPRLTREQVLRTRAPLEEQVANLWRDPYPGEAVFTRDTLLARLSDATPDDRDRFLARVERLRTRRAVAADAVKTAVAAAASDDGFDAGAIEKTLSALPTVEVFAAADLAAIASNPDVVSDRSQSLRLSRLFLNDMATPHIDRTALLANLSRVEPPAMVPPVSAPTEPPAPTRSIAVDAPGGRLWELWQAVKWLAVIYALGLAVWPITSWVFSSTTDRGYAVSRTLGLVLVTYVSCIAVLLGVGTFGGATCTAALGLVTVAAWWRRPLRQLRAELPSRRIVVATESLFLTTFAAFALVRAYNPAIYWGEKTMDFSLLNAVMRSGELPPYEPWFAGAPLNYYYYGYFLVGTLTWLTGSPTAIAFNLAIAMIAALTLTSAFSLVLNMTNRIRWGLLGAAFVGIVANLDAAYQLGAAGRWTKGLESVWSASVGDYGPVVGAVLALVKTPGSLVSTLLADPAGPTMWDSYWASSRAIGDGLINEYPLWSWLFADLHAHVLVMPVSLLSLSLIALLYQSRTSGVPIGRLRTTVLFGLLAVLFGTMLATNIWDFVAYGGVLAVVLVAILRGERQGPHHRLRFEPFHEAVCRAPVAVPSARLVAAFLVGWVILWPWLCSLHPYWLGSFAEWWIGLLVGAVLVVVSQRQDFVVRVSEVIAARLWSVVQRAGLPGVAVLAAAVTLFAFFVSAVNTNNASLRFNTDGNIALGHALRHFGVFAIVTVSWLVVVLSARPRAALPVVLATVAITGVAALSGWWGTAGGAALYALLATAAWMTVGVSARDQRWTGVLLTCGWGVAAFSELVVLNDRMNTVFKFYHPAWMLLAVGSAGSAAALATRWRVQATALRAAIAMTFVAAMAVAIAGSYRAVSGVVTRNLKPSATPTLDGLDFLRYSDDERELGEATEWLNHHGGGGFAVGEAFTNTGYDDSARVAKYTGLPIVLGWPHHLSQRGHNSEDIAQRARDLVRVYTTRDPQEFAALTSRYRLRYLLVGDLERQHYSGAESALRSHGSVREVFRSVTGRYVIFEVTLAS